MTIEYDISRYVSVSNPIDALSTFFVNRWDAYAIQTYNEKTGRWQYIRIRRELTVDDLIRHNEGEITLGLYQMWNSDVIWGCYDVDNHSGEREVLDDIGVVYAAAYDHDLPLPYVEPSGSGDSVHLWYFFEQTNVRKVHAFLRELVAPYGLHDETEVYPKQSSSRDGAGRLYEYGNLVKAPFGVNQKTGNRTDIPDMLRDEVPIIDLTRYDPEPFYTSDRFVTTLTDCILPVTNSEQMVTNSSLNVTNSELLEASSKHLDTSLPLSKLIVTNSRQPITRGTIRPCFNCLIKNKEQLSGGQGHSTRVALVAELRNAGWNVDQICDLFKSQADYNEAETKRQVASLMKPNYRPFTCDKLQMDCARFVLKYCKTCLYQILN